MPVYILKMASNEDILTHCKQHLFNIGTYLDPSGVKTVFTTVKLATIDCCIKGAKQALLWQLFQRVWTTAAAADTDGALVCREQQ